jgi:hypothetical protein
MQHGDDNYTTTITGRRFWPLDPWPEDICIEDIAHALSHLCRFNGHVHRFYSVAQHSVIVSQFVPTEYALCGLLHDAAEAYIGDMSRPLKHDPRMVRFRECDNRLTAVICQRFGLPAEMPACVKDVDTRLLQDEVREVALNGWARPEYMNGPGLGIRISPWPPDEAKHNFLWRFHQLYRGSQWESGRS